MNPTTPRQLRRLIYQMIDAYAGTGSATDHGTLTGLSDDDHNQYAKKASNLSDLTSASTARTNLSLGTLATASTIDGDDWSGTDLAVINGGTGASTASDARTNLGVAIGSDVQAYSANLASLSNNTLAGELDASGNNIIDLADVTFKTGAVGGTLRTGTSAADKFELQAYDVDGSTYQKVLEVDAGNSPQLEVFADSFAIWDNADETKQLFFTLSGGTTGVTTELIHSPTANRQITFPDATGTIQLQPTEGAFVDGDKTKLDGIETSADVTDTANVTAAGALMDSEVDADIKTLSLPANTTISTFGASLIDDAAASNARTTLGLGSLATASSINNANWSGTDLSVANGGTGRSTSTTAYGLIAAGTTATGAHQTISPGSSGHFLKSAGASALAGFAAITEADISDLDHDAVKIQGVGIDATVGSPTDGKILVYRSAGSDWVLEDKPASGSNPALNDVSDVTISTVADNEVLAYDNSTSEWINQTAAEAGLSATGHSHTESDISDLDHLTVSDVLSAIYPVGSLYTSTNSSLPSAINALGTWTVFGTGRVMVNQDTGDTDFDTLEETGGHKELQQHNHGVTDPGHNHSPTQGGQFLSWNQTSGVSSFEIGEPNVNADNDNLTTETTGITIDNEGTGDSGNLQPYIVVKTWKRTA